jgi:hypothetical protein
MRQAMDLNAVTQLIADETVKWAKVIKFGSQGGLSRGGR